MGLFTYINSFTGKSTYTYAFIIISSLCFFQYVDVTLGVILSIALSIAAIMYLNEKQEIDLTDKVNQHNTKLNSIYPKTEKFEPYYDIVDFFFSIQDFYMYNAQAYEEMVHSVEDFITIYENMQKSHALANTTYELAEGKKLAALNALQSMIYNLPQSVTVNRKLVLAMDTLENMLNRYQEKMLKIHKEHLYVHGYSNEHKLVNLGPKPHNYNGRDKYTYSFY